MGTGLLWLFASVLLQAGEAEAIIRHKYVFTWRLVSYHNPQSLDKYGMYCDWLVGIPLHCDVHIVMRLHCDPCSGNKLLTYPGPGNYYKNSNNLCEENFQRDLTVVFDSALTNLALEVVVTDVDYIFHDTVVKLKHTVDRYQVLRPGSQQIMQSADGWLNMTQIVQCAEHTCGDTCVTPNIEIDCVGRLALCLTEQFHEECQLLKGNFQWYIKTLSQPSFTECSVNIKFCVSVHSKCTPTTTFWQSSQNSLSWFNQTFVFLQQETMSRKVNELVYTVEAWCGNENSTRRLGQLPIAVNTTKRVFIPTDYGNYSFLVKSVASL